MNQQVAEIKSAGCQLTQAADKTRILTMKKNVLKNVHNDTI